MIINDINYIETVEAKEVQGGLSLSTALSNAFAFGRGSATTVTATGTSNLSVIGIKLASSGSFALGAAEV
jgi:hypothetical protein